MQKLRNIPFLRIQNYNFGSVSDFIQIFVRFHYVCGLNIQWNDCAGISVRYADPPNNLSIKRSFACPSGKVDLYYL
jgi:hypothetical protein